MGATPTVSWEIGHFADATAARTRPRGESGNQNFPQPDLVTAVAGRREPGEHGFWKPKSKSASVSMSWRRFCRSLLKTCPKPLGRWSNGRSARRTSLPQPRIWPSSERKPPRDRSGCTRAALARDQIEVGEECRSSHRKDSSDTCFMLGAVLSLSPWRTIHLASIRTGSSTSMPPIWFASSPPQHDCWVLKRPGLSRGAVS